MSTRKSTRKRASPTKRVTTVVEHCVECFPAEHGVEPLPDTFACEMQAMLDSYGLASAHPEARRVIVLATRLRQAWQSAEARCIERHRAERRTGSPERAASMAYRRAMASLLATARELAAMRH